MLSHRGVLSVMLEHTQHCSALSCVSDYPAIVGDIRPASHRRELEMCDQVWRLDRAQCLAEPACFGLLFRFSTLSIGTVSRSFISGKLIGLLVRIQLFSFKKVFAQFFAVVARNYHCFQ